MTHVRVALYSSRIMKHIFLLTILLTAHSVFSQKTGKVDYPHLGLTLAIPEGWIGQESELGLVLGHNEIAGMVLVSPMEVENMNMLRQTAIQGIQDGNGSTLMISGDINDYDSQTIGAYYQGTIEWTPVKAYTIGKLSPHGAGLSIYAMTQPDLFNESYRQLAEEIDSSITFRQPETEAITKGWKEYLSGHRLRKMNSSYNSSYDGSYTGHSTDVIWDLCPDGHFTYSNNSSYSVGIDGGGAYGYNDKGEYGTWEIGCSLLAQPILILNYANGEVYENQLAVQNGEFYMNGSRVFRLSGQDGPNCR